jgi:hypothetical protein
MKPVHTYLVEERGLRLYFRVLSRMCMKGVRYTVECHYRQPGIGAAYILP